MIRSFVQPLAVFLVCAFLVAAFAGSLPHGAIPVAAAAADPTREPTPDQVQFFEKKIRPVFSEHCYQCHSTATRSRGKLQLDSRDALLKGGKSGAAIVLGDPAGSLLLQRILSTDEKLRMPKDDDPLPQNQIDDLRTWIAQGAYWPAGDSTKPTGATTAATTPTHSENANGRGRANSEDIDYFQKNVKTIFDNHCQACHAAATKPAGGLRLDTSIGIQTGGRSGAVVIAGDPEKSLLLKRILQSDEKKRMPKDSPALNAEEVATLKMWIKDGAAVPDETEQLPPISATLAHNYDELRKKHWAYQPLTHPAVPEVANIRWPSGKIDRFLLAALEAKKLAPVSDASPETLIRRVTFDLTGLPAAPKAVAEFRRHHSERDYERVVDELLASPQYGERWGRHWLDVARYGESTGPSRNMPYPHAWRYRDYVIDAYNRDLPFNRFLTEQIAGDLLPAASAAERDRLQIATGFLALGVKDVNQRFEARYKMDNVDDQIDTVTRSVLATTASCARCHDHKFDPIPTRDYYALAGIFTSTEDNTGLRSLMGGSGLAYYDPKHLLTLSSAKSISPPSTATIKRIDSELNANKRAIDTLQSSKPILDEPTKEDIASLARIGERLREEKLELTDPGTLGFGIHGVREGTATDTPIRIRGIEERHGPAAPRGFLTAFEVPGAKPVNPKQSGRLELAEWLTNSQNPLTARVAVNRIWAHLFGQGIVTTVDNFGVKGDLPSNPELLDYLANDFIENGWSNKKLIREIVLSHAYRLGSDFPEKYKDIDQANHLVWRHSPRRLEAEEVRDAILASSGRLNLTPLRGSPAQRLKMIEMNDNGAIAKALYEAADQDTHRSIYLPLLRGIVPRPLAAFDPVPQTLVTGQRDVTVVPTQPLFLLNSSFVREQSLALAQTLTKQDAKDRARIEDAYRRILGRDPNKQEIALGTEFLVRYGEDYRKNEPGKTSSPVRLISESTGSTTRKPMVDAVDDQFDDQGSITFDEPEIHPDSAEEASLAAFVQALYGSAEFQFLR